MASEPHLLSSEAQPLSRSSRVPWWRMAFTADTWRGTAYLLFALPPLVVALPAALLGGSRAVAHWQCALARRYLGLRVDRPPTAARVVAHTLLSLPVNLASLVLVGYMWLVVVLNLAYPLEPGVMDSYQTSWGGPTLAGAWAVHAAGGLVFLLVTPWVVRVATRLQARLMQRLLG